MLGQLATQNFKSFPLFDICCFDINGTDVIDNLSRRVKRAKEIKNMQKQWSPSLSTMAGVDPFCTWTWNRLIVLRCFLHHPQFSVCNGRKWFFHQPACTPSPLQQWTWSLLIWTWNFPLPSFPLSLLKSPHLFPHADTSNSFLIIMFLSQDACSLGSFSVNGNSA